MKKMTNPIAPVKNTRKVYNRYLEKVITEVQVQFDKEDPAWIPYDTLIAAQRVYNNDH